MRLPRARAAAQLGQAREDSLACTAAVSLNQDSADSVGMAAELRVVAALHDTTVAMQ